MQTLGKIIGNLKNDACRRKLLEFYSDKLRRRINTEKPDERILQVFKALANPTRLWIFHLLLQIKLPVCLLVQILGLEQTLISHHLRVLRDANLVDMEVHGKFRFYKAKIETLQKVLKTFLKSNQSDQG